MNPGKFFHAALTAALLILCLSSPARADFQAGLEAYKKGDHAGALARWKPLAEQGDRRAQTALGNLYDTGKGVQKDADQAAKWYGKAADQLEPRAMALLGLKYSLGAGLPKDPEKAYRWLNLAYFMGIKQVKAQVEELEKTLPPAAVKAGREYGAERVKSQTKNGNYMAQAVLGAMYALGRGVPKDLVRAYMWLEVAEANGFPQARELRDTVGGKMSKPDIVKAKGLAGEFLRAQPPQKK